MPGPMKSAISLDLAPGYLNGAGDGNRTHVVSLGILSIQHPTTNSNSKNSSLLDSV